MGKYESKKGGGFLKSKDEQPNLLCLFLFSFYAVWQMGITFFSTTTLSVNGKTPLPVTADKTSIIIVLGYVVSAIVLGLFRERAVLILRANLLISIASTMLMFFPVGDGALTVAFYIQSFFCVFMICGYTTVVITRFAPKTEIKRIFISMLLLGVFASVLHFEKLSLPFWVFNAVSCVCQIFILVFLFAIPSFKADTVTDTTDNTKKPRAKIAAFVFITFASGLLICFSNIVAESAENGVSVMYIGLIFGALLFLFLNKMKHNFARLYHIFLLIQTLGFVLALASLVIPWLLYASSFILGVAFVSGEFFTYYGIFVYSIYKSKLLVPIATISALVAAILSMVLLDAFRDNVTLLYAVYAVVSVVTVFIYAGLERVYVYEIKENEKARASCDDSVEFMNEETADLQDTAENKAARFSELTEQENNLAQLILQGYTESAISEMMNISINTQKSYRKSVYLKLCIHSKRELFEKYEQVTNN